ncbi:MAG TPA: transglutaminase domain-containing protein [Nitrososphaeraceae archaeon]|nr:transglutaminase domain-containing protein [Nitrososphaeraceae archaeon]
MFDNNLDQFTSSFVDIFKFYKRISEQYTDHMILDSVKQSVPDKILKLCLDHQSLIPLLYWFKNDLMKWMPKEVQCSSCNMQMKVQVIDGDSTILRKTEVHSCGKCGSSIIFPRYVKIQKIAETKIGRCSEWSILFGAILNSLSLQTRIVHDFLDHCWNESLINNKWIHLDSTLNYPISFNHPYYYEQNWGKDYEYVLAFSANSIEDVTRCYTEKWHMIKKRREKEDKTDILKKLYSRV